MRGKKMDYRSPTQIDRRGHRAGTQAPGLSRRPLSQRQHGALGNYDAIDPKGWAWPEKVRAFAQEIIDRMGVKGRAEHFIAELSGGNQQKALIGRWVERKPQVCFSTSRRAASMSARALRSAG